MAIVKNIRLGHLEVSPDGVIFVKEYTEIVEDGVVISSIPHRAPVLPTDDVSNHKYKLVKDIAGMMWTPQLKADFIAEQLLKATRKSKA